MSAKFIAAPNGKSADPVGALRKRARQAAIILSFLCAASADTQSGAPDHPVTPVAISEHIETTGARLYFEARGDSLNAPLLLWLHGGPGGAERPLFRYFNGDLERHFLVVYYDQRGAGQSFDPEAPATSLTIGQHIDDLDRVINHLQSQYRRDRVLVVGHSWGAALGMLYAKSHPEKVAGLICVAPVVSISEQHRREYEYDTQEAARRGDASALRDLAEIGPPPYQMPGLVIRLQRITERYNGVEFQAHNHAAIVVEGVLRGLVTPWEIVRIIQGIHRTQEAMHQELLALDLRRQVKHLDVPVFFFLGRHDHHVDANLSAEYFETLRTPLKEIVWFEQSAHDIPFDEPRLFNAQILNVARKIGLRMVGLE